MLQFPVLSGISKQKKRSHCSVSIFMQRTRSPEPATRGHGKRRRASRRSLVSEASSWPWPHRLRRMRRPRPPAWQKPNPDMYVVSCLQAAKGGFFFFFFFRERISRCGNSCAHRNMKQPRLSFLLFLRKANGRLCGLVLGKATVSFERYAGWERVHALP